MSTIRRVLCGIAVLCCTGLCQAAAPVAHGARVVGSSLEVVDADGVRRAGLQLAGVELLLGAEPATRLRIVSVTRDPGSDVVLHEVEAQDSSGAWRNVCEPDRDNRRLALFIAGHDTPDGRQVPTPGQVSLTCSAGVQGKCLRAGYRPWDDAHGAGSGNTLFQACTRMFRADYCGDGIGWTRNGMAVDIFDVHGIQRAAQPATLPFEAAWGPDGAVCVHHTRVQQRGDLAALLAACPRLAAAPTGAACSEAAAAGLPGALLFNRSADYAATGERTAGH